MLYRLALPHLAVVALTIALAACGADTSPIVPPPADPGYRSLHVQDEASLGVTATGMMAAIGCGPVHGRPDSTAVAIPLITGKVRLYRCPGVPLDSPQDGPGRLRLPLDEDSSLMPPKEATLPAPL